MSCPFLGSFHTRNYFRFIHVIAMKMTEHLNKIHEKRKTRNFRMKQLGLPYDSGHGLRDRNSWQAQVPWGILSLKRLSVTSKLVSWPVIHIYPFFQAPWSKPLSNSSTLGYHLWIYTSFFFSSKITLTFKLP